MAAIVPAQPPPEYSPYNPAPQPVQNAPVVIQQPAVIQTTVIQGGLSDGPTRTTCPHCSAQIVTNVDYNVGLLTWLLVGGLCVVGCWLCCFIPLCVNACKDVTHTCPNCQQFISRHSRI